VGIYWVRTKKGVLPSDGISISVFLGLVVTVFCTVMNEAAVGFPANRWLVSAITYGGMYIICVNIFRDQPAVFRFVSFLLHAFSIIAVVQYGYIEFVQQGRYEGEGLLVGGNLLAIYLLTATFLVLHFTWGEKRYSLLLIGLTVVVLIALGSRTAILSGLISGFVVIGLRHRNYLTLRYLISAIVIISGIACLLYLYRPDSMRGRFLLWEIGLSAINSKNWVIGNGLGFIEI